MSRNDPGILRLTIAMMQQCIQEKLEALKEKRPEPEKVLLRQQIQTRRHIIGELEKDLVQAGRAMA